MNFFDFFFWQSFVSNLGATIFGVVLGILGALGINRLVESRTEKEKKTKILSLLYKELDANKEVLKAYRYPDEELPLEYFDLMDLSIFLREEVWRAFSDGGEIQWIKKPELIEKIANSYFFVRTIKIFSERYFLLSVNRGVSERVRDISAVADNPDIKRMEDKINEGIDSVIGNLDKTISDIQSELK